MTQSRHNYEVLINFNQEQDIALKSFNNENIQKVDNF